VELRADLPLEEAPRVWPQLEAARRARGRMRVLRVQLRARLRAAALEALEALAPRAARE
jgi:hypothetical protein